MSVQNFAATARYFERRALRTSNKLRRRRLQEVALYYLGKAEALGQSSAAYLEAFDRPPDMSDRRRRLIELFRAYDDDTKYS
jgi:hypothetical protein